VSPVQIHVEFNDLYMRHVATLGSGDPEDDEPMAWGNTPEEAANELLALEGFPQDTPYVVC
jgi:hypothetical protein